MLMPMKQIVSIDIIQGLWPVLGLLMEKTLKDYGFYLGRFSKMSKEMATSNQIDLLSDALSHYSSVKKIRLGTFIL